jgi:hypothetical protein
MYLCISSIDVYVHCLLYPCIYVSLLYMYMYIVCIYASVHITSYSCLYKCPCKLAISFPESRSISFSFIDLALKKYQRAYKLVPFLDNLLREHAKSDQPPPPSKSTGTEPSTANDDEVDLNALVDAFHRMEIVLQCLPERPHRGSHISVLPAEVFTHQILCRLVERDPVSVVLFGRVILLLFMLSIVLYHSTCVH